MSQKFMRRVVWSFLLCFSRIMLHLIGFHLFLFVDHCYFYGFPLFFHIFAEYIICALFEDRKSFVWNSTRDRFNFGVLWKETPLGDIYRFWILSHAYYYLLCKFRGYETYLCCWDEGMLDWFFDIVIHFQRLGIFLWISWNLLMIAYIFMYSVVYTTYPLTRKLFLWGFFKKFLNNSFMSEKNFMEKLYDHRYCWIF